MSRQITRVGIGLIVAFIAVFLQLNYVQIYAADDIASNNSNARKLFQEYSIKRGNIVTADDVTIARSVETEGDLKYERRYPGGDLYGHITGYYSIVFGTDAVESAYNDQLLGESGVISMQDIEDSLFGSGEQGDNVQLSLHSELQATAREVLGGDGGAVVALDPESGEVLAMWSNPSYDPTPLASHSPREERRFRATLQPNSQSSPLINQATQRAYPPGSTFKVVTAAAAIESGEFTPGSTFPDSVGYQPPQTTSVISNFSGGTCVGGGEISLEDALTISCNTTFARIGQEVSNEIVQVAEDLGWNDTLPFDLRTTPSRIDVGDEQSLPQRSLAAIGQGENFATPLQMALVAATVANDGVVVRPRVGREIIDPSGGIVDRIAPEETGRAFSATTANTLTSMMRNVVLEGSGTAAQIPGVFVAGKTGTAQTVEGAAPHAWFICFAGPEGGEAQIAVAVIVENGGSLGSEATGGAVAAPIARAMIERDKDVRGW